MLRTNTCGELSKNDIDITVSLCGWVAARRDHGKIIFIDIRDRYGITQVVFLPKPEVTVYELAKQLRNEDVICVKGKVCPRPEKTENHKITTGLIEVCAQNLDILSQAEDLPFSIEEDSEITEEVRLAHRYLDLRRKSVLKKIILRDSLNQGLRKFLSKQGFLEIETPFLTKSTPEGARDYLVPSRLNRGKFYALPQSPQLFKQILMVAGVDKYCQIVRCFRDEDLRRDRQPEFTQLDLEMSFIEEEDIFSLTEKMIAEVFSEVLKVEIKTPFLRISHKDALDKHKIDKPDIGEGDYRFLWVTDFPLFEYNQEEKRWQSSHHPFTAPSQGDLNLLDCDPAKIKSRSYDLILNGAELASGSIRIHSAEIQKRIFDILGISKEEAENKFGFLLKSFKYGVPPHGGIAFGLDRLYAIISGSESIRDVIAFPKTQKGICPLSGAPSEIGEDKLEELGIDLKVEAE